MSLLQTLLFLYFSTLISTNKLGTFVHVTDFHLDVKYGKVQDANIDCWNVTDAIFGRPECDSPEKLVRTVLEEIKQQTNPDFIVYTGDSFPHLLDEQYRISDAIESLERVTSLFKEILPDTVVYPVLGNHDFWPQDQLPDHQNDVYDAASYYWKDWIGEQDSLTQFGYYKAQISKGHVLLALNTNFYHEDNEYEFENPDDPGGQFKWLEQRIAEAKTSKSKVHLIGHVPPGAFENKANLWWMKRKYADKLVEIIKNNANMFGFLLFGHSHKDSFRLVVDAEGSAVQFILIAPSVTPWINPGYDTMPSNPAFRLLEYDKTNYDIHEISTYYLNINESNALGQAKWYFEYNYTTAYDIEAPITAQKMETVARNLQIKPALFDKYFDYNSASFNTEEECVKKCKEAHLCALEYLDFGFYNSCLSSGEKVITWLPYLVAVALVVLVLAVILVYIFYQRPKMRQMQYSQLS